jgi:hypothetical protein
MKTKESETKTRKPAARKATPEKDAVVLEYCLTMFSPEGELLQQINMEYFEYSTLKLHRCMWETTDETFRAPESGHARVRRARRISQPKCMRTVSAPSRNCCGKA